MSQFAQGYRSVGTKHLISNVSPGKLGQWATLAATSLAVLSYRQDDFKFMKTYGVPGWLSQLSI